LTVPAWVARAGDLGSSTGSGDRALDDKRFALGGLRVDEPRGYGIATKVRFLHENGLLHGPGMPRLNETPWSGDPLFSMVQN
jgi:hypothetical protein